MDMKNYFARIYVINLPERTDRRVAVVRELEKARLPLEPGKVELFPAIRPSTAAGFANIGYRGCFLSHFNVLKRANEDGLRNVLIMEDDLVISPKFLTDAATLVGQLQATDWGFVYFGHVEKVGGNGRTKLRVHVGPLLTTHFLGINASLFEKLLTFLKFLQQRPAGHPDGGPMSPDGAYSTFRRQNPDVTTLIAVPNLGWQGSSRSDLCPRWFDRVFAIRQAAGTARRLQGCWKGRYRGRGLRA